MTHCTALTPKPFLHADSNNTPSNFALGASCLHRARPAVSRWAVGTTLGALAALLTAGAAHAEPPAPTATLDTGDQLVHYTGGGPIGNNELNVDDTLFWFHESTGVYQDQAVDSWYVFFDPAGSNSIGGTLSFATPILYTFTTVNQIIDTIYLGDPNVRYNFATSSAGLEPGDRRNTSYSGGTMTFAWSESADHPGDFMRVLTAATPVPEPASGALALAGLAGVVMALRRRRRH